VSTSFVELEVKPLTPARFEAAWRGDLEKIKSLTLGSWDNDEKEPPLMMAVSDTEGNNPFSLAFLRGHFDVAKAILEIAQAQWVPEDESKTRYKMTGDDDNDDSCEDSEADSDDNPEIFEEIVDDKFTIENIGQVSMQVKSKVLATTFLNWTAPTFVMDHGKIEESNRRESLLNFAMRTNDKERFKLLVDMDIHFTNQKPDSADESESSRFYAFPEDQFRHAVRLGRIDLLADVIKRTGAGIPLE
jgi:ankyrin repeat protein